MPLKMAAYSQPQWEDGGEGWSVVSRVIEKSRKTPGEGGHQLPDAGKRKAQSTMSLGNTFVYFMPIP